METTAAPTPHSQHRQYHHGKSPAGWFGSMVALAGFVLASIGALLGPSWPLVIAGAACVVIGMIGGWGLSVAGYGQPPRP